MSHGVRTLSLSGHRVANRRSAGECVYVSRRRLLTPFCSAALVATWLVAGASAQLPVTGRPVSQLAWLDDEVLAMMDEFGISGGLVALQRNGVIIYQRGFGWNDSGQIIAMPENSLCRTASCTKPFTGAAIQRLAGDGALSLEDFAFDLGQTGGGLLPLDPYPSLGDEDLKDVKIRHCLTHTGGWDRSMVGDLTYHECAIADDMDIDSPPGRTNTMRWILGQPLQCTPGMTCEYSNIGYLACGLIVEEVTGQNLLTYLRQNVLTRDMWVPWSDFRMGRTFEVDAPAREVWYDGSAGFTCVFDNSECVLGCDTPITNSAYGAWDHEARLGQGAIVLSPATALRFMDRYNVQLGSQSIGAPLNGERFNAYHNGILDGCNAYFWQRDDGINLFMFFNEDATGDDFGSELRSRIESTLDDQSNWPTLDVEGFWAAPTIGTPAVYGSYDRPFRGLSDALNTLEDGSILNLKTGNYVYAGTISTQLRLRAPLGLARIGG